jgi:hypothetical protein
MKHTIITTLITLISALIAHAERVDIAGYFSIDFPAAWTVKVSGVNVNQLGKYVVYEARGKYAGVRIGVCNDDAPDVITYADYQRMTNADLPKLAHWNHSTGWSTPTARKDVINGIPVLFFREVNNQRGLCRLDIHLWVSGKSFVVRFVYNRNVAQGVNGSIDSMRSGNAVGGISNDAFAASF